MPVGYNVQVVVDTTHHLIITHEVTNVGTDRSQLAHVAKETKATLEAENLDAVADRGYFNFWRWAQKGIWERLFKALSDDPDFEYVLIDATHIRVHQHGTGAKGGLKIRPSASRAAA
jgi:transposase